MQGERERERVRWSMMSVSSEFIGIVCVEWDFKETAALIDSADSGYDVESCCWFQLRGRKK